MIKQLNEVQILFTQENAAHEDYRRALSKAEINLRSINENILIIWGMRTAGKTDNDISNIIQHMKVLFGAVTSRILEIQNFVKRYNDINHPYKANLQGKMEQAS